MYAKEMVKQSLPLLIICGFGLILAGNTFGSMKDLFQPDSTSFIPGLIVVIPAIIALRGNISTAFGSRLGSAYHLGIIDSTNLWNEELKQNIIGSLILSFIMSLIIGILAYITSLILGINPNPLELITVVVLAGALSGVILTLLTILIIYLVFRRGYDPDNITGPALATFGDIVTILCIFWSAIFIGGVL
jgi:mgtE-like transporter